MKEIARVYNNLKDDYESLKSDVENTPTRLACAASDIFSLEPFYQELNHIPDEKFTFYESAEELAGEEEIYYCFIAEQLICCRIYYGQQVYYDNFFIYEKNEKWRYQVYVNEGEVKPIKVERFRFADNKDPISYETYSEYGYTRNEYRFEDNVTKIDCFYYALNEQLISKRYLSASYNDEYSAVNTIIDVTDNINDVLYDSSVSQVDLTGLIDAVKEIIVKGIIDSLSKQTVIKEELLCILLEYTLQSPFPSTVALGKQSEMESNMEEYGSPLAFYNAPDMAYFSEESNPEIKYSETSSAVFEEINSRLKNELDFEELKKTVFGIYLDICKTLKRKRSLKDLIPVGKDFHVCARDFEECNEWEYLQEVLPKKLVSRYKNQIDAYEEESGLSEEEIEFKLSLANSVKQKQEMYPELVNVLQHPELTDIYAEKMIYYFQPFSYEIQFHKINPVTNLAESKEVRKQPIGDNYYHYRLDQDHVCYIGRYRDGKLITQRFYMFDDDLQREYYFEDDDGEMTAYGYTEITMKNDQPVCYSEKSAYEYVKTEYKYDEQGNLFHSDEYDVIYVADDKLENQYTRNYRFENNTLARITRNPAEEFSVVSAPIVEYCSDHSYLDETIEDLVAVHIKSVLANLSREMLTETIAIVLEYKSYMIFPFYYFYLVDKDSDDAIYLKRIEFASISYELEKYGSTFHLYTMYGDTPNDTEYLSKDEAVAYTDKAFSSMAQSLSKAIESEFNVKLPVLSKMSDQPNDILNDAIDEIISAS